MVRLNNTRQRIYTELNLVKEKKMTRPTRIEKNCTTGEELIIELTDEEIAQMEEIRIQAQAEIAARETEKNRIEELKVSARTKLVAGEPLTEEEAATIVL